MGLAEWVEIDEDIVAERATMQESQECVELVGNNNARGTRVLYQYKTTHRGVQGCTMHGVL